MTTAILINNQWWRAAYNNIENKYLGSKIHYNLEGFVAGLEKPYNTIN